MALGHGADTRVTARATGDDGDDLGPRQEGLVGRYRAAVTEVLDVHVLQVKQLMGIEQVGQAIRIEVAPSRTRAA